MANGRRAVIVLDVEAQKGRKTLADLSGDLSEVAVHAEEAGEALQDTGKAAAQATEQAEQVGQSVQSLGRVTSSANQVLFTAGDAVQDIGVAFQHGADTGQALGNAARFAGNNIAFGAEQVALLASTAQRQGVTAMQALITSITGVGGLIVGIQLAITILPQLIDWLSSLGDTSTETAQAIFGVSESLKEIREAGPGGVLSEIRGDPELRIAALQMLQDRLEELRRQRLELFWEDSTADFEAIDEAMDGIRIAMASLESESAATNERIFQLSEGLGISVELAGELVDLLDGIEQAPPEPKRLGPVTDTGERDQPLTSVIGGGPPGSGQFAPEPDAFDETISKLNQIGTAAEQGIITPFEAAQQRAAALQQGLMDMIAGGVDPSSTAFQILAEQLGLTQEEIEELQEEVDNTSAVMESQMITSANRVGQALIEAFRGGKEEGEQLLRTVISVATRLGASAIGGPGGAAFSLVGGLFQGAFAHGTTNHPGGWSIVGEEGPELVNVPRGSQIHSTQDTGRIFERQASVQAQQTEALRREVQGLRQALYESPPQINLDPLDFTEGLRDRGAL